MRISDWSSDVCSSDLPLLDVVDRQLERALAFAERARRDCQAFARELLHHDREATPRLAQKIAGRYANVVEEHLRGIRRFLADLVEVSAALETRPVGFNQDQTDPLGALVRKIGRASCRERVGPYV